MKTYRKHTVVGSYPLQQVTLQELMRFAANSETTLESFVRLLSNMEKLQSKTDNLAAFLTVSVETIEVEPESEVQSKVISLQDVDWQF